MAQWHLARAGQALGTWPDADMRAYYAEGRVAPYDLVWTPGMTQWRRAQQVFGAAAVKPPPKLHWAWVLVFSILTLGVFYIVWAFVQAAWMKRIDAQSNAVTLLIFYVLLTLFGQFAADIAAKDTVLMGAGVLVSFAGTVALVLASFSMRASLLAHFNEVAPIGLKLSKLWTFLGNILYIQHHLTQIAKR